MQTSSRTRDFGGGLPSTKRGHAPQLSITDDNHHVTEAIGDMYGNMDFDSRPQSVVGSPLNDQHGQSANSHHDIQKPPASRPPLSQTLSNDRVPPNVNGQKAHSKRSSSYGHGHENGPMSPTLSELRSPGSSSSSDTANSQFPLNDIDYESDPAAVAQELSNLQALRRMSMDVNAAGDPDLPFFNNASFIPTRAPTHADDEDAASRLYWVPARLHPELAPKEFKTFVETRVKQIRRRSGDDGSSLSPDSLSREGSGGGLRRKKSMLSKQIDNSGGKGAEGYKDGAERLERKRSQSGQRGPTLKVSDFQELDELVNDPTKLIGKLSLDTSQAGLEAGGKVQGNEDMPILPAAPPGNALRRSTRTTYRRGSLRKGERVPYSKRAARAAETDTDDSPASSPVALHSFSLSRVQTEPIPSSLSTQGQLEKPSRPLRPGRGDRISPAPSLTNSFSSILDLPMSSEPESEIAPSPPPSSTKPAAKPKPSFSEPLHVPRIIETPPPPEDDSDDTTSQQFLLPARTSSHEPPPSSPPQIPLPHGPPSAPPSRSPKRPSLTRETQNPRNATQTLNDIVSQPSPFPGSANVTPTFNDDKKPDKKRKEKDKDNNEHTGGKKSGWGWLLGSEEKEKDKDHKDPPKKSKMKGTKTAEKPHDNTRLDLLQTSIDGGRGRESSAMDRENVRLEEERKKESVRKSSAGEPKREKESGIFSFFGSKRKSDRDGSGKKSSSLRAHSPEPPPRVRKPDIDYNWTRFSILEERAIYRMAHIKLANPRRALYSQVLLSNFMYSYLAKVQQMHPQIQVPQSAAAQKNLRLQQEKQQSELKAHAEVAQAYQDQQQRQEDNQYYQYHDQSEGAPYVDDSQIYDYEHGQDSDDPNRPKSRAAQYSTENGNAHHQLQPNSQRDFQYQSQFEETGHSGGEMW
ncbi:MAG: hypothetical protein M1839_002807 [Geoglossum umbratile]|nr:MAG: hypothetical protein M1839_002807 [Geoglossum umbratile]